MTVDFSARNLRLFGIQLLETNGEMETNADKGPKGQAVREGEDSPVQETGGDATGSRLCEVEPDTARLDKHLSNLHLCNSHCLLL